MKEERGRFLFLVRGVRSRGGVVSYLDHSNLNGEYRVDGSDVFCNADYLLLVHVSFCFWFGLQRFVW